MCFRSSYTLGSKYRRLVSSSSVLSQKIPRRCASGAYKSRVSAATSRCFFGGTNLSVRMLCVRSASLTRMTRISRAMATIILRKFSACCSSLERNWILPILVTPSTNWAISAPNSASITSRETSVSSTVSCKRPVMTDAASSFISAMMPATYCT